MSPLWGGRFRDYVVIERGKGETGQAAGFQSFRMRTFKGMGHDRWLKKVTFVMDLESQSVMI